MSVPNARVAFMLGLGSGYLQNALGGRKPSTSSRKRILIHRQDTVDEPVHGNVEEWGNWSYKEIWHLDVPSPIYS